MSDTRTIVVKGGGIRKEAEAATAITPGHFLQLNAAGTVSFSSVAEATANKQVRIAVENEVVGKGTDDNYAIGDWVLFEVLQRGAEFYAVVAAGTAAIASGAPLNVSTDGSVVSGAQGVANVATALEAVDNSGGGTATWILCEAL